MRKRVIATLLAAAMIFGVVGCGNEKENGGSEKTGDESTVSSAEQSTETESSEEKEPVTITYWYRNAVGEQQYTKEVEKALNDILKETEGYEHISIELHPTADMETEFTLAQAGGAQIDLVAHGGLDFNTHVANGDFIALDELMAQYPNVTSELPDWMVDFGIVNGEQYYIPAYQEAYTRRFIVFPDEYLEMYYSASGKTEEDVLAVLRGDDLEATLDFYEDYLLAVREGTGKETKWMNHLLNIEKQSLSVGEIGRATYLYEVEGQEPIYWSTTETFKAIAERMSEWYEKGYIHPDFATIDSGTLRKNNMLNDEAYVWEAASGYTAEQAANACASDIDCTAFWLRDHDYVRSNYGAGGNAIYAECEHPEEAMMIIELLMTQKGEKFYNTLVWGLEGVHWEWEDEANKRIRTLEYDGSQGGLDTSYHAWKWNIGNTFNAWKNQAVSDELNDMILSVHNSPDTVLSDCIGITWDLSKVSDQVSQCNAVSKEYDMNVFVMAGDDLEKIYNEYLEKLETAGVQDIMDTVLEQYHNYTGK